MPGGYIQKTKSFRIENVKLSINPNQWHLLAKMQNEQVPIRHFYNPPLVGNLHTYFTQAHKANETERERKKEKPFEDAI